MQNFGMNWTVFWTFKPAQQTRTVQSKQVHTEQPGVTYKNANQLSHKSNLREN
jgi:hypothetical protein